MKYRFLLLLTFVIFQNVYSQNIQNERYAILLKIKANYSTKDVKKLNLFSFEIEEISKNLNIYKITREKPWTEKEIGLLKQDQAIEIVQNNRNLKIVPRATTPNDTFFYKQAYHNYKNLPGLSVPFGINSINAWDFDKSITTKKGDTIVVAVIEPGFDSLHEDIDYFTNYKEIPNDSIDNDNNGYIDDYRGWNSIANNSNYFKDLAIVHGTNVSGIIGAKGNNIKGISGVAWNIKILPIAGMESVESIIKAYDYIITMKKNYLLSNKLKGAYIVATNLSGGTIGFENDEPIWCSIYDSLGKYGILNVSAADNEKRDVSIGNGDLPTNCSSDYLITSTILNNLNKLDGAYSRCNVDISANSSNVFTTNPKNSYIDAGTGTSFASPMITGTIALMYSNMCPLILDSIEKNPLNYLKKLKNELLINVDSLTDLNDKIVSSGKLNVYKSIKNIAVCSFSNLKSFSCKADSSSLIILSNKIKTFSFVENGVLFIKKENNTPTTIQIFDVIGRNVLNEQISNEESRISVAHLNRGIYILTIENKEERENKKIEIY